MKTRQVLVVDYDQCQVLDVSGPVEALNKSKNELDEPCYEVSLVAAKLGKVATSGVLGLYVESDYGSIDEQVIRLLDTADSRWRYWCNGSSKR
ncbi:MAG: transcriptional regulator GlxA family with amidase domain [Gammaproteobacteria bacterium]|jgi:transcriptional regulator GlxA family with amidase domain